MNAPGKFIVVEGMEGCGKTTNLQFVYDFLIDQKIAVVTTREPGGTPLAEEVRNLLLANREEKVTEEAELLLVFAARAQHLIQKIKPSIVEGKWVLCDRFTDATYAYQGGGRGLSQSTIGVLEELVQKKLRPDLVLILDVSVEKGLERAGNRGTLDRFEREKADFFERVRSVYLQRAAADPQRYKVIDADCSIEEVQQQLHHALTEFMNTMKV